jgi:hypothetical protein
VPKGKGKFFQGFFFVADKPDKVGYFNYGLEKLPQGIPLGRKLSQFFFFFVWAWTLWALVTSPDFGP